MRAVVVVSQNRIEAQAIAMAIGSRSGYEMQGWGVSLSDESILSSGNAADVVIWLCPLISSDEMIANVSQFVISHENIPRIVVVGLYLDNTAADRVLEAGALGYLASECDIDQLYEALDSVSKSRSYVGVPRLERIHLSSSEKSLSSVGKDRKREAQSEPRLSARELEVLHHTADGLSIKEIAYLTNKSPKTIDACRRRIMHKLNTFSIAGLTKYAIREGFTSL